MDKRKYKLISTVVSLTVYSIVVLFVLTQSTSIKFSAKKQKAPEEIFIDITAMDIKPQDIVEKPKPKEQKVAKKKAPKSVKNLFSDINETFDTENLFEDKVEVMTRKKPKKISVDQLFDSTPTPKKSARNIIKKIDTPTAQTTLTSVASEGVSDEYFNQVQEAVSKGWYPRNDQKGMKAVILIKIATDGSFDFYFKGVSGDQAFLAMLKKHMQELQQQGLPKPKKKISVTINFIAKE